MTALLSVPDAVKALNARGKKLSLPRAYALVATGELPAVKIGGRLHVVDLDTWILEKARTQTHARQRPQFSIVKPDRIRRFGTSDRKAVRQ